MKYTSNYNLKKPDGTDNVFIDDLNGNMDLIDVALINKAEKTDLGGHTGDTVSNPHNVKHEQTSPPGVDESSTDITKNKHLSDAQAKEWTDHKNASAPHNGHALVNHTHAGGDISGQVGDADTVDGKHAAYFAVKNETCTTNISRLTVSNAEPGSPQLNDIWLNI